MKKETEKYGEEDKAGQAAEAPAKKAGYQVLAVTACPTGIGTQSIWQPKHLKKKVRN